MASALAQAERARCYNDAVLDLNFITENLDFVAQRLRDRGADVDLNALVHLNEERKSLQTEVSTMRHQHGAESKKIGGLFKEGKKEDAEALRARLRDASDAIKAKEDRQREVEAETQELLIWLPNLAHESVPVGTDESDNVEVRRWGEPRSF